MSQPLPGSLSKPLPGLNVQATLFIKPEHLDEFLSHFEPIFQKVSAEPECMFFEVFQSMDTPGVITLVENWNASKEWIMEVHAKREYLKPYFETVKPFFAAPSQIKFFDRLPLPIENRTRL